jgi:serine/threonine-protein phosphatase 2A regulatory subunit B''
VDRNWIIYLPFAFACVLLRFRCLDLDGDGRISLYEMEAFYKEQYKRMMTYRMSDPWKFSDFVCSL